MIRFLTCCFVALSLLSSSIADESCTTYDDCYENGKVCDGIQDVGCICKKGLCKISSGCGTYGAFFRTGCETCEEEGCEDEGACKWIRGKCMEIMKVALSLLSLSIADESCTTYDDCYENGKVCDGITDVGCICKKGLCKISSGCGTYGAFFRTGCETCEEDGCEDEGACKWIGGRCMEIPTYQG